MFSQNSQSLCNEISGLKVMPPKGSKRRGRKRRPRSPELWGDGLPPPPPLPPPRSPSPPPPPEEEAEEPEEEAAEEEAAEEEEEAEEEVEEAEEPRPKARAPKKLPAFSKEAAVEDPPRPVMTTPFNGYNVIPGPPIEKELTWLHFVYPITNAEPVAVLNEFEYTRTHELYSIYSREFYDRIPLVPMRKQSIKYRHLRDIPICMRCFRRFGPPQEQQRLIEFANRSLLAARTVERERGIKRKRIETVEMRLSARSTNEFTVPFNRAPEPDDSGGRLFLNARKNCHICTVCETTLRNAGKLISLQATAPKDKKEGVSTATLKRLLRRNPPTREQVAEAFERWKANIQGHPGGLGAPLAVPKLRSSVIAVPGKEALATAVTKQVDNEIKLKDLIQSKLQDSGIKAEDVLVSGAEAFFLIKNPHTGKNDLRTLRQSRFWILINTFRRLTPDTKVSEANIFRDALNDTFSDRGLKRAMKFNQLEENGRFSMDSFEDHVIKVRVQGGVEIGPVNSFLHAHLMLTIDHISNISVGLQRDTALSKAYEDDCLENQFNESFARRMRKLGEDTLEIWHSQLDAARKQLEQVLKERDEFYELINQEGRQFTPEDDLELMRLNDREETELKPLIKAHELKIAHNPPESWEPARAILMFDFMPEERFISKMQAYMVKAMPETQRKELLNKWAGQNPEDHTLDFVYSVLDDRRATNAAPPAQADTSQAFVMGNGAMYR